MKAFAEVLPGRAVRLIRRAAVVGTLAALAACYQPPNNGNNQQNQNNPNDPQVMQNGMFSAPLQTVDLPIQDIRQETQVWCWAAVSQQIILASKGPQETPPQCALVAIANGQPAEVCCRDQNPACVRTGTIEQIQGLIAKFGGRWSSYAPPTDPMTLYRTLAQGHAVIIGIDVGGGQGHVVVARGMSFYQTPYGWEPLVHINDPEAYYTQPVPYRNIARVWKVAIVID